MESNDQTAVCFKDSRWLEVYPLNKDTALDYFALSGFYDRTCNNEWVKMQRGDLSQLKKKTGIEYTLLHWQDSFLYVIRKQKRESPTRVIPNAIYYIINGTIYQSPTALSVISSRMINCLYYLQKAFKEAEGYAKFDPYTNYFWEFAPGKTFVPPKPVKATTKETEQQMQVDSLRVDQIINLLSHQFPVNKETKLDIPKKDEIKTPPLRTPPITPITPTNPSPVQGSSSIVSQATKRKAETILPLIETKKMKM